MSDHPICVGVASTNPAKIRAATAAFQTCFAGMTLTVEGVAVPSGVSDQPFSDEETLQGAQNRAENAARALVGVDYAVGLEGGVEEACGEMRSFAWAVVRARDGRTGKGRTATYYLPERVAELIRQGKELGEADDIVFGQTNSKQKMGAVGLLTGGLVDRAELYSQALVLALVPFLNSRLYE